MKLRHLLTVGLVGILSTSAFAQDGGDPEVVDPRPTFTLNQSMGFTELPYKDADVTPAFLDPYKNGNGIPAGNYASYKVKVEQPGEYILYFERYYKNKDNTDRFTIYANEKPVYTKPILEAMGGNWFNGTDWCAYVMEPCRFKLEDVGEYEFKILSNGDRWTVNPLINPVIVSASYKNTITDQGGSVNVLYGYEDGKENSPMNYTGLFVSNKYKGDYIGSLITSTANTSNGNDKNPWPKSKLYFPISVDKDGHYPVTVKGLHYIAKENFAFGVQPNFLINVNSIDAPNGNITKKNSIETFTIDDTNENLVKGTGTLNLAKGDYYIELSSLYGDGDLFFIKEMVLGELSTGTIVNLNAPEVFLGKEFTVSGSIVNAPEDKYSINVYISSDDSEEQLLGSAIPGDDNTFNLNVNEETSKEYIPELGSYYFTVKLENGEKVLAFTEPLRVDVKTKTYSIELKGSKSGVIKVESDGVSVSSPGNSEQSTYASYFENSTVKLTATTSNSNSYVKSLKIDGVDLIDEITKGERLESVVYEFTLTSDISIEAEYTILTYKLSIKEDNCIQGKSHVNPVGTSNNWRQGGESTQDSEDGISIWSRDMNYGDYNISFTDVVDGTYMSRILLDNEPIVFETHDDFDVDGKGSIYSPAYRFRISMNEEHFIHPIHAWKVLNFTTTFDNEAGNVVLTRLDKQESEDDANITESNEDDAEVETTPDDSDADGVYTFYKIENGVKNLKLKITPEKGYNIKHVEGVNVMLFKESEEEYTVMVKGVNPSINVSFEFLLDPPAKAESTKETIKLVSNDKVQVYYKFWVDAKSNIPEGTNLRRAQAIDDPESTHYGYYFTENENNKDHVLDVTTADGDKFHTLSVPALLKDVDPSYNSVDDLGNDKMLYIATYSFNPQNNEKSDEILYGLGSEGVMTGIENILNGDDADNDVEYFNLQGVKVSNPEKGIYIMRQGSKVSKVIF